MCPGRDAHPKLNEPRAGTQCGVEGDVEAMDNIKHCGEGESCDDHDNGGDDIDDYFLT